MDDMFNDSDFIRDSASDVPDLRDFGIETDVPSHVEVLPDGREVVVIGDPEGDKAFTHRQGDNLLKFLGTCGLCSCENVLRSFGLDVNETDMVIFAAQRGLCNIDDDPRHSGGTTTEWQADILTRHGIAASASYGGSLDDLAGNLEQGHGVIIEVNAGVLWDDANDDSGGHANHAITVTGVARDPSTGEIQGFFINDSGTGKAAQFVDASVMHEAWEEAGGEAVVTAESRPYNE
jgi:hypothetical protein